MSGNWWEINILGWLVMRAWRVHSRGIVGDDATVITSKVVGFNECVSTLAGHVIGNGFEAGEVCGVKGTSDTGGRGSKALHKECNAEGFQSLAYELLDIDHRRIRQPTNEVVDTDGRDMSES